MSVLERLSRLVRANVNDLINKAEDPNLIIEQSLRDMESAYNEARREVAEAMGQGKKLQREADTNRKLAAGYEEKAEEALKKDSEDLAREALKRARNYKDLASGFEEQIAQQQIVIDQLKTQLRALEAKIDEMKSKKSLLAARQKTAQAGEKLQNATSGFGSAGGAMNAFDEMEKKVQSMEDKNAAFTELNEENDIDAQLNALGRDQEIDDALAELKKKINQ